MLLRERQRDEQQTAPVSGGDGPPAGGGIGETRAEGTRLLDVADDLLSRALSGDSEAFLAANRQQGGE